MGKRKKPKLQPGDLIVSLDDEDVGLLIDRKQIGGLLKGYSAKKWAWDIDWVKGGPRAIAVWGASSHHEDDLIEDIKSGYWILYNGID
jgi:hypothetical protein